jgi:hypothetical protein
MKFQQSIPEFHVYRNDGKALWGWVSAEPDSFWSKSRADPTVKNSILLFYTILSFWGQTRPSRVKAETEKTIVAIGRISNCQPKHKPAKTPFFTPQASALARLRYAPNH